MTGASVIPRHWVYNEEQRLVEKSAIMDFADWYGSPEEGTPWAGPDSPVTVVDVESDCERRLSQLIMKDRHVERRSLREGDILVSQGQHGTEIFLLLDGLLVVEIDGAEVAEVGPGAIVGEQAALGSGLRMATLRAATNARVAVIPSDNLDYADREALGLSRQREADQPAR
jgi:CRP-like cAMP-binding protein